MKVAPNIDCLESGSFRVRVTRRGAVLTDTAPTLDLALLIRDKLKAKTLDPRVSRANAVSIASLGPAFIAHRRRTTNVGDDDENRFHKHIATAPFARRSLASIDQADDVRPFLAKLASKMTNHAHGERIAKPLSRQTRKHIRNLLSRFFDWAIELGHLRGSNPCDGVRIERSASDDDEGWQESWYLDPEEQKRFLACWDRLDGERDRQERLIVECVLYLGVRESEAWCLHLEDVHVDDASPHIVVRFGTWDRAKKKYRAPKWGRTRRVQLWGPGLVAMRAWLACLPSYAKSNPFGLVFPTERGKRRDVKPPRSWAKAVALFGIVSRINRKPWMHLLRHTCATSLLSGSWAERWPIEQVAQILGHRDLQTCQRYAKLFANVLDDAASNADREWRERQKEESESCHDKCHASEALVQISQQLQQRARKDSNFGHPASKAGALSS